MKTKKQVMDEFFRLQKKYADIIGFADLKAYKAEEGSYWAVTLTITAFKENEISWREILDWTHFSNQHEEDDTRNEAKVKEFVERMEARMA